ncbi:unnamed protein product, partial [Symbiodinium necroappetens]
VAIASALGFRICAALPLPAGIATLDTGTGGARAGQVPGALHRGEACTRGGAEQACLRHRLPDQGARRRGLVAARPGRASSAVSARLGHRGAQAAVCARHLRRPGLPHGRGAGPEDHAALLPLDHQCRRCHGRCALRRRPDGRLQHVARCPDTVVLQARLCHGVSAPLRPELLLRLLSTAGAAVQWGPGRKQRQRRHRGPGCSGTLRRQRPAGCSGHARAGQRAGRRGGRRC